MTRFAPQQTRPQAAHPVRRAQPEQRNAFGSKSGPALLAQQHGLGNQVVQRLLRSRVIQAKLKISAPGDKYEQEADRVAEEVMRMPEPQSKNDTSISSQIQSLRIQRMCPTCEEKLNRQLIKRTSIMTKALPGQRCESAPTTDEEEEEPLIMTKAGSRGLPGAHDYLEDRLSRTKGRGNPLPDQTRFLMESKIGYDFSGVRVHTDSDAIQMARELNAEAFTSGRDIYFNAGRYSPNTQKGKKLLTHELTHVVQQRTGVNLQQPSRVIYNNVGRVIQRYALIDFPQEKENRMRDAIIAAETIVANCKSLSGFAKFLIIRALKRKEYIYKPTMEDCGWTYPTSSFINISENAFDKDKCCHLSSTLAHEVAHTQFYTEGRARRMECKCFDCC